VKDASYYKERDAGLMNFVVKDGDMTVYDDFSSLKAKVSIFYRLFWIIEMIMYQIDYFVDYGGGGIHLADLYRDDREGLCGCGPLPFLRMTAELLNPIDCDPLPCLP
jgi:hypothetical protein